MDLSKATCATCPNTIDGSLGSNLGYCQMCWEQLCAEAWWTITVPTHVEAAKEGR